VAEIDNPEWKPQCRRRRDPGGTQPRAGEAADRARTRNCMTAGKQRRDMNLARYTSSGGSAQPGSDRKSASSSRMVQRGSGDPSAVTATRIGVTRQSQGIGEYVCGEPPELSSQHQYGHSDDNTATPDDLKTGIDVVFVLAPQSRAQTPCVQCATPSATCRRTPAARPGAGLPSSTRWRLQPARPSVGSGETTPLRRSYGYPILPRAWSSWRGSSHDRNVVGYRVVGPGGSLCRWVV
jgi:hypothetical protein